jgi:hypothetical protein
MDKPDEIIASICSLLRAFMEKFNTELTIDNQRVIIIY